MWILSSKRVPDVSVRLLTNKEYTIGRQSCDIVISDDATVSRKHALLKCVYSEGQVNNTSTPPKMSLTDVSKFGSWVNGESVRSERQVSSGDEIRFGSPNSTYVIIYEPFIVSSSCLDNASKTSVRSSLRQLGGHMVNEWSQDCSLLVMTDLSVTIKVVNAIVSQKHVVTPVYLQHYVHALAHTENPPHPSKYLPPLAESQLNPNEVSFAPNPARKSVFNNLTFFFINPKQMKKLKVTVELCGGRAVLLEGRTEGVDEGSLVAPHSIVMHCDGGDSSLHPNVRTMATHVSDVLARHEKRAIADSEIGYAVLYCSTQKHCNPTVRPGGHAFTSLPSQTFSMQPYTQHSEVLVQNTESSQLRDPPRQGRSDPPVTTSVTDHTEVTTVPNHTEVTTSATIHIQSADIKVDVSEHDLHNPTSHDLPVTHNLSVTHDLPVASPVKIKTEPRSFLDSESSKHWNTQASAAFVETQPNRQPEGDMIMRQDLKQEFDDESNMSLADTIVHHTAEGVVDNGRGGAGSGQSVKRRRRPDAEVETTAVRPPRKLQKRSPQRAKFYYDSDDDVEANGDERRSERNPFDYNSDGESATGLITATRGAVGGGGGGEVKRQQCEESGDDSGKVSQQDGMKQKHEVEGTVDRVIGSQKHETGADSDGFLNTRQLLESKMTVCKRYEKDAELPVACVQSKYANLVRCAAKQPDTGVALRTDGMMMWQGELLKNFKTFTKNHYIGANQLPRIIGGRDLEIHTSCNKRSHIDDMFRADHQVESQYSQETRRVDEIFEMSFQEKVKKRR